MTNKKMRRARLLANLGIGICTVTALAGLCMLGVYARDLKKAADVSGRLMQTVSGPRAAEAETDGGNVTADGVEKLAEQNADFAGWISIPGSALSAPVMYTPDEPLYYLKRNFDGEESRSGTPFIDAGCSISPRSDNVIVYGHHMKNGSVFAELLSYREQSFYEAHQEILFTFPKRQETYEIFAVCAVDVERLDSKNCYSYTNFADEEEFEEYLRMVKALSVYDTGVTASYGDRLLMLSTCSYHVSDGRFMILAKQK